MSDLKVCTPLTPQPQSYTLRSTIRLLFHYISAHLYTMFSGVFTPKFPAHREELRIETQDPQLGIVSLYVHYYSSNSRTSRQGKSQVHTTCDLEKSNDQQSSDKLCILVHGLASTPHSKYLSPYIHQGLKLGYDVIALALRGSVGEGVDHYHAGLTADVHALLASQQCAQYKHIVLIGFSLGGQVVLRYAYEGGDARVKSVGAVCPPIDLEVVQCHLDRWGQAIYRRFLLASLKKAYQKIWHNAHQSGTPLKASLKRALKSQTIYEWDQYVVLSRYDFDSVKSYHAQVSLNTEQLSQLCIPSCLLFSRLDPVIPLRDIWHHIEPFVRHKGKSPSVQTQVKVLEAGGHIRFPSRVDLSIDLSPSHMSHQLFTWMEECVDAKQPIDTQ